MRFYIRRVLYGALAATFICIVVHSVFVQLGEYPDLASGPHLNHDLLPGIHADPVLWRKRLADRKIFIHDPNAAAPAAPFAPANKSTGWELFAGYKFDEAQDVWPVANDLSDRMLNQLHIVKPASSNAVAGNRLKTILLYHGLDSGMNTGQSRFIEHGCPVNQCSLSGRTADARTADLIMFKDAVVTPPFRRPSDQIWVIYMLESPLHTPDFAGSGPGGKAGINWTATYRRDSTLVAPYERFSMFKNSTVFPEKAPRNMATGKTKKVAWFVSNCAAANGRGNYATVLGLHIAVDIYGACGSLTCSRAFGAPPGTDPCGDMLKREYKFYLAFENSNCRDYITEKLYWNAMLNNVLPIVMGARREDYERSMPPHSFIHVDDFESPRELAAYLHKLDNDDDLYSSYFRWHGTGSFIDTKFWCRLCSMLHEAHRTKKHSIVTDMNEWWRGDGVCVGPVAGAEWATWRNSTQGSQPLPNNYEYWEAEYRIAPVERRRPEAVVVTAPRGGTGGEAVKL